jgi:predicted MPP superfamily phosphohydrolase
VQVQRTRPESERAIFLGDVHVPFEDKAAVDLALAFTRWFKPETVFLIGDIIDFYSIPSKFDRDPSRLLALQEELDATVAFLKRVRKAAPNARIVYLSGNHEHRLIRYLWKHPEISVLKSLRLPVQLGLDDLEIEHHEYHEQVQWHGLLVEHGDRVSKVSAATAKSMLDARGVCGISGHVHRLGMYYKTDNSGVKVWMENGCLCSLSPSWIIGKPNWCHGFTIGYANKGSKRFICEQIPILSGKLWYQGQLWEAKREGVAGRVGVA